MPTFRLQSTNCTAAAIAFLGVAIGGVSRAEDAAPAVLSPKDAGARYGQALGAVEICYGSKVTGKATALGNAYTGTAHDDFEAQSAKIFESWIKVKNCADARDPGGQRTQRRSGSGQAASAAVKAAGRISRRGRYGPVKRFRVAARRASAPVLRSSRRPAHRVPAPVPAPKAVQWPLLPESISSSSPSSRK